MPFGRSFIKGPRFAFQQSKITACERCTWGTGHHAAGCVAIAEVSGTNRNVRQAAENERTGDERQAKTH